MATNDPLCVVLRAFLGVSSVQFCLLVNDLTNYSYVISLLFRLPVNSRSVPQLGTGARLGTLVGHVVACLAVRYGSSVRKVAGQSHVVFGCVVRELG
jgi:hypothetical protein